MWITLAILITMFGIAGILARSRFESKQKSESNPADAFDIIEDV